MNIKPEFKRFLFPMKSNHGFSITEVMVAAGLIAIVGIGATSLMSNMQKEQRRNVLLQVLASKKLQFENAITDSASWANTLAASGGTAGENTHCLVNQTTCSTITIKTGSYITSYQTLILRDGAASGGAVFYDGTGADGSKQGFTESGSPCHTFTTAAAGNDACPIGYRVSWAPQSIIITNPNVTVYAKLIYNPSDTNPFKTFINAPADSTTINSKYDVQIDRTPTSTSKSFFITYTKDLPGSDCSDGGYGQCITGAFGAFGTGGRGNYSITSDQFLLIDPLQDQAIRIKSPGSYKCTAKSYAFGTDGAYLQIRQTVPSSSVLAGPVTTFASRTNYGYATLILDSVIQVTSANTEIVLEQKCENLPTSTTDLSINNCSLGFSGSSYTPTTQQIATLNCVLID